MSIKLITISKILKILLNNFTIIYKEIMKLESILETIKEARKDKKLSQADMAQKLGWGLLKCSILIMKVVGLKLL